MPTEILRKFKMFIVLLLAAAILSTALISCGTDEYAVSGGLVEVMVTPASLNKWITNGYSDSSGYTKMVVLSVDSDANYTAGHVPDAYQLDTSADLSATRFNGVSNTVSQVATKAQMDALIQRTGIDANTVVVLTGGGTNMMSIGRAYFNFRYWGFPKNRLRVLNGTSTTYESAGYTLQTSTPALPTPSTYDVCDLTQDTSVRASFEDMLAVAEDSDASTIVLDARSADEYNGVAGKTTVTGATPTYVAFEGHVRTAAHQEWTDLVVPGGDGEILSETELLDVMALNSVTGTDTTYSYCRTSWRAAVTFLALDASLGWDTKIYDGAWIEWGQMAGNEASIDGSLDPFSAWLTNSATYSEAITYNKLNAFTVEPLAYADSGAASANEINTTDAAICGNGGGDGGGNGGGDGGGY